MPRKAKHRQLSKRVSVKALPVTASDRTLRTAVGSLGMLVGIAWVAVTIYLLAIDPPRSARGYVVFVLLLGSIGLGICISGLYHVTHYASLTITSEAVTFAVRGWSGRRQWSEPLAKYEGVLLESEVPGLGEKGEYHHTWNILMEHPEEGRRILLWREPSERKARRFQERCCHLLKLAALEPTAEGVARREVEDLGEPLQRLPIEQNGQASPDTAASVPARLRVLTTPREAEVTLMARMPLWLAPVAIGIAALLWCMVAWGVWARLFTFLAFLATLGACWAFPVWLWGLISRPRLHITDEAIELIRELPLGEWRVKRLGCDEIVAVTITKRADQFHEAVVLRGRRRQIRFGKRLELDELQWLKDFILDRLAKSGPAAAEASH